jgi:hypothetical protein
VAWKKAEEGPLIGRAMARAIPVVVILLVVVVVVRLI